MVLKLLPEHLQTIHTHAESTYPEECCGLILGYLADGVKTVVEVKPAVNAWNLEAENFAEDNKTYSSKRRYAIAPQFMLQVQKEAGEDRSLNIIGIYHSHPDHPAIPSECVGVARRRHRLYAWQGYSYIIVSVTHGTAGTTLSWSLDDSHQFQPEIIDNIS